MARLANWFQWSLLVAYVSIFGVAAIIALMILGSDSTGSEGIFRLLGVAAIIDGAFTILIPIFHWLSRGEFAARAPGSPATSLADIDAEIARLRARLAELERHRQLAQ
jgi:hypothetical protein